MRRVLVFGTFDPLHPGHLDFFRQAKALGDHLHVVVARDAMIQQHKQRPPAITEAQRLAAVAAAPVVDEAQLGSEEMTGYPLLRSLTFDILALGYDQTPSDEEVRHILAALGKPQVQVVRLKPYKPEQYKSSYLRSSQSAD